MSSGSKLELLIFRLFGILLGADTGQVSGMYDPMQHFADPDISKMHELIGFDNTGCGDYVSPNVLIIKGADKDLSSVLIDSPEDIVNVPVKSIRAMPYLLEGKAGSGAIWGAVDYIGKTVMLLDLNKVSGLISDNRRRVND